MSVAWLLLNKTPSTPLYAELSASTVIAVRFVQKPNGPFPMVVTLAGMVTLVKLQFTNA